MALVAHAGRTGQERRRRRRNSGGGSHLSSVFLVTLQNPLEPSCIPGLFPVVDALVLFEGIPGGVLLEAERTLKSMGVGMRAWAGVEAEVGGELSA